MVSKQQKCKIMLNCTDCMDFMRSVADQHYELAIVDPPYGIRRFGGNVDVTMIDKERKINTWDKKPPPEYFAELFRVSKNQIIWGANNFELPPSEYFAVWDKKQMLPNFARCELAYVSMGLKKTAKIFEYSINKLNADRKKEGGKINPCQKPIELYRWLLDTYAKDGDKILETHGGSMSIAIACYDRPFDLNLCEIDKEYYDKGVARVQKYIHKKEEAQRINEAKIKQTVPVQYLEKMKFKKIKRKKKTTQREENKMFNMLFCPSNDKTA